MPFQQIPLSLVKGRRLAHMPGFKDYIEARLKCLKQMPLTKAGRAANMAWFSFGKERVGINRIGEARNVSEFALHVQCAWRLVGPSGIIVGHDDMYHPVDKHTPADLDGELPEVNRCDERLKTFFASHPDGVLMPSWAASVGWD
jgi:hypothetical protein